MALQIFCSPFTVLIAQQHPPSYQVLVVVLWLIIFFASRRGKAEKKSMKKD